MDKSRYRQRLEQIIKELYDRQEFISLFRDRKPGYIDGYADALNEMIYKLKAIEKLTEIIEGEENKEAQ